MCVCVHSCTVNPRKGCTVREIKTATTDPPLLSHCQEQLTGCLAVTLDINQSSDLVQWSEQEQLQNGKTAVSSSLIPVPICKMPWVMSRKHLTLPSLPSHRWKSTHMCTKKDTHNLYPWFYPSCAPQPLASAHTVAPTCDSANTL